MQNKHSIYIENDAIYLRYSTELGSTGFKLDLNECELDDLKTLYKKIGEKLYGIE